MTTATATAPTQSNTTPAEPWVEIINIPLDKIRFSKTNPRKWFNPAEQEKLENSMRQHGFTLSTLLVRPISNCYYVKYSESGGLWHLYKTGEDVSVEAFKRESEAVTAMHKLADCFELVTGECRHRSATSVGIRTAPCIVQILTDNEVFLIQLVENIVRADLLPMEEAEALKRALELKDEHGKQLYDVEALGKRLGVGGRHVSRKIKLCLLNDEARKLVNENVLPESHAYLIARVGDPAMREKAFRKIMYPQSEVGPLPYSRAEQLITHEFIRDIAAGQFDPADDTLLAEIKDESGARCGGGACSTCPMKAANMPGGSELPNRSKSVCYNPICFEQKQAAAWVKWAAAETDPARNRRAISRDENIELFAGTGGVLLNWTRGFIDLNEHPDSNDLRPGVNSPGPWMHILKSLIAENGIEILVARDGTGKVRELVKKETALEHVKAKKFKGFKVVSDSAAADSTAGIGTGSTGPNGTAGATAGQAGGSASAPVNEAEEKEKQLRLQREKKLAIRREQAVTIALVEAVEGQKKMPPGYMKRFALGMIELASMGDTAYEVAIRRGIDPKLEYDEALRELVKLAEKMPDHQLGGLIFELVLAGGVVVNGDALEAHAKWRAGWAKLLGVKPKDVEKKATVEFEQEEAQRRQLAPGMRWLTGPSLANEFTINTESRTITNPDQIELVMPKGSKVAVVLRIGAANGGFYSGFDIAFTEKKSQAKAPSLLGVGFDSWQRAALEAITDATTILTDTFKAPAAALAELKKYTATLRTLEKARTAKKEAAKEIKKEKGTK